jgi:hypothetical protein
MFFAESRDLRLVAVIVLTMGGGNSGAEISPDGGQLALIRILHKTGALVTGSLRRWPRI